MIAARFKLLIIAILASAGVQSNPICRHFYVGKWRMNDVIVTSYMPIDFGYHDKIMRNHEWQPVITSIIPSTVSYDFHQRFGNPPVLNLAEANIAARIMPGTPIKGSHYFSVQSTIPDYFLPYMELLKDPKNMQKYREGKPISIAGTDLQTIPDRDPILNDYMMELYDNQNLALVEKLVSYDLTWETYLAEGTVKPADIESFKQTEKDLDPRRKITFELSVPDVRDGYLFKRTLGIMRIYDGSPYPTSAFSHLPTHNEAATTDPRVPIERRYPEINFREDTEYIFEPGRLAKSPDIEGMSMIEYQFHRLAGYLHSKFGLSGIGPKDYFDKGKVLAEITGRNLKKFMTPRSRDGFGYTLDYIVETTPNGRKITKVKSGTKYSDLKHKFNETDTKFILHQTVGDYINNF